VRLNRGNVHLQRNEPASASAEFAAATEHYAACGDEYGLAKARHNLGYSRLLEGDLP
jgi:hypothetical protein